MLLEDGTVHHDGDDDTIEELGLQHKPERGEAWQLLVEAVHANPDRHDPALWLRWVAAFLAPHTGACPYNRPCAQQYVGKSQSCMVISGRLIVHAPVQVGSMETVLMLTVPFCQARLAPLHPMMARTKTKSQRVAALGQSCG